MKKLTSCSRRAMIGQMAAAAFLSAHEAAANPISHFAPRSPPLPLERLDSTNTKNRRLQSPKRSPDFSENTSHRIHGLRLLTSVSLKKMQDFYCQTLGLDLVSARDDELVIRVGGTSITFVPATATQLADNGGRIFEGQADSGEPFYHFAFNIAENKIMAARQWQLQRTPLVPTPVHLRDPAFPDDIRHFNNWNAHSIFFFDPAYNIVEYIARHDLKNTASDADNFGPNDLMYCSEIGFIVEAANREQIARQVGKQCGLQEYPKGSEPWAMGDERGLLLILGNLGVIWGENTQTPVRWGTWPTEATIVGPAANEKIFSGKPYLIHSHHPTRSQS